MAPAEARGDPAQFAGWFPSDRIFALLENEHTPMPKEELSKAVSLAQLLPICTSHSIHEAVPMTRALRLANDQGVLYFASLHPGLKSICMTPSNALRMAHAQSCWRNYVFQLATQPGAGRQRNGWGEKPHDGIFSVCPCVSPISANMRYRPWSTPYIVSQYDWA